MMSDMMMSAGLRRNRRSSRSMMAHTRCMATSLPVAIHHDRAVCGRRLLQRVAKLAPGVVDEDVVERGALHREGEHLDSRGRRLGHQRRGRLWAAMRREARD